MVIFFSLWRPPFQMALSKVKPQPRTCGIEGAALAGRAAPTSGSRRCTQLTGQTVHRSRKGYSFSVLDTMKSMKPIALAHVTCVEGSKHFVNKL